MTSTPEPATDRIQRRHRAETTRAHTTCRVGFQIALATSWSSPSSHLRNTAIPNDVPYPFASDEIADQWPGDYL